MVAMDVVQMTLMDEIDVITMWNHGVLRFGVCMHVVGMVTRFGGIFLNGEFGADGKNMLIHMIRMRMVHMPIMQIIRMPFMGERYMSAVFGMCMVMGCVYFAIM